MHLSFIFTLALCGETSVWKRLLLFHCSQALIPDGAPRHEYISEKQKM